MKPIILLTTAVLLLCSGYCLASDPPQTRPMTRYEKAIANITDPNDLKTAYDTMKTDYDRRYFLNALPGYFTDHKIQTVPDWVEKAVLDGIKSKDPLMVYEALITAGNLKIGCAKEIMGLYNTIPMTFGCQEDMIESAVFLSVAKLDFPEKQQFLYDAITKTPPPVLSPAFENLLWAMESAKSQKYATKLSERLDTINVILNGLQNNKEEWFKRETSRKIIKKIESLLRNAE